MKRGDIVTVASKEAYSSKPRPGVIIQADFFAELDSVTLALLSTERVEAPLIRIDVAATAQNGLKRDCQVMVDKTVTVPRDRIGYRVGTLDHSTMTQVERSLAIFLGIA